MTDQSGYLIRIGSLERELPIVPVGEHGPHIAFLKLYGDNALIDACVSELLSRVDPSVGAIIAPEAGGILLAHLLAQRVGVPYAIARKKRRPNMKAPLVEPVGSIGTEAPQKLYLDDNDRTLLEGRNVLLVDEVSSGGSTMRALRALTEQAGGSVTQALCVATEGTTPEPNVVGLVHLPLFEREGEAEHGG